MSFARSARTPLRPAIEMMVALGLLVYFGYHTISGERGIVALSRQHLVIGELQSELAALRSERARLERRVRLLRPESVDPDMLGERAREMLYLSRPEEFVVFETGP